MPLPARFETASRKWLDARIETLPYFQRIRARLSWTVLLPIILKLVELLVEAFFRDKLVSMGSEGTFTVGSVVDTVGLTREGEEFYRDIIYQG